MTCINLAERFGARYRIAFDESYDPRRRRRENLDPWFMEIPCRRGTIYPYGGKMLAVLVDGRSHTARRLQALPGVRLLQNGGGEKTFLFHVNRFPAVAAVVRPRRKRQMSPNQRQAAVARLTAFAFSSRTSDAFLEAPTHAD